jgi:hypothetical protein
MAHLAQVYIRLLPYDVDTEALNQLGKTASDIALHSAEEYYRQPVAINVALDVGSLTSVVTVTTAILLSSYTAVANYKNFRDSIDLLCAHAHEWGTNVRDGFTAASGAEPSQIATKQIRYKTPGELRRLFKDVERSQAQQTKGDVEGAHKYFDLAVKRWRAIRGDLTTDEVDRLQQILRFEGLPPLKEWPLHETERAYRQVRARSLSSERPQNKNTG